MPAKIDIVGKTFTRWFVVSEGPDYVTPKGHRFRRSWCKCSCGNPNLKLVVNQCLNSGSSRSCGCLMREISAGINRTHGLSRTKTHRAWKGMRSRCKNPNYPRYGKLGIKVCKRWQASFTEFLKDMGECPPKLSIDRWPNKYGHYSCGKCEDCALNGWKLNARWATIHQQARNTRTNFVLSIRGITGCLKELCEYFHVSYSRTLWRLRAGWDLESAFFSPRAYQ